MKGMNKKAWLSVAGCALVVAAALTLPALWMIRRQDALVGQMTYLPDYTTIALGQKAASHPVARSLYEHKQTFLIQGDQADWTQLDQEQVLVQWELLNLLMADCPTVRQALEGLEIYELAYDDVPVMDEGTLLGLDRIHMERDQEIRDQSGRYSPQYWIFNFSYDPDTQKVMSLNLEHDGGAEDMQERVEMLVQEAEEDSSRSQEIQESLTLMAREYLAYLDLEENSFQEIDLELPEWVSTEGTQDYYSYLLYSADYQIYLYVSLGYLADEAYAFNLGAASLTPEELEKCLMPYN